MRKFFGILAVLFMMFPAYADADYYFPVDNNCHLPVWVAVRYQTKSGRWVTHAWHWFAPREKAFLATRNNRLLVSDNRIFYFYAETDAEGAHYTWEGAEWDRRNRSYSVDGRRLRFRRMVDRWWNNDLSLACPDIPGAP